MRILFIFIVSVLSINLSHAAGKKPPPVAITFHTEAADLKSKKLTFEVDTPNGKRFINKSPFIATKDIVAYKAFPSPHSTNMYGVTFELNRSGASRLKTVSTQYTGSWIMCSINGVVVDMLYIDKPVSGRMITIWRGVDNSMLNACNSLVPRIGESKKAWKDRLKK